MLDNLKKISKTNDVSSGDNNMAYKVGSNTLERIASPEYSGSSRKAPERKDTHRKPLLPRRVADISG